jgi:hypothetical protein
VSELVLEESLLWLDDVPLLDAELQPEFVESLF